MDEKKAGNKPNGPSANAVAVNRHASESIALRSNLHVNPSRRLMRNDTVVRVFSLSSILNESLESALSATLVSSVAVQATENGCEVHSPRDGM